MAGNSSMRAGGIHWAATLDAGGFEKGARQVRAEATRLQKELESIRRNFKDSPFAQRVLSDRARESAIIREAEGMRFQAQTAKSLQASLNDLAKSERMAKAESEGFSAGALSLTDVGVVGAAIVGVDALTKKIAKLGEGLTEIAKASFDSTANMNNLVESFIRSIPIVGNVEKALTGVYDIVDVGINGDKSRFGVQAQVERTARAKAGSAAYIPGLEGALADARDKAAGEQIRPILRQREAALDDLRKQHLMPGDLEKAQKLITDRFDTIIEDEMGKLEKAASDDKAVARGNEIKDWIQTKLNTFDHFIKDAEKDAKRLRDITDADKKLAAARDKEFDEIMADVEETDARAAERERDRVIGRAQGIYGAEQNAMGRTIGAVTRGSQAALSLMANRNSDPVTLTAERMKELLEVAKRQLKIEEDAQRAWQEAYGAN